jgi:hypothetical protein
MYHGSCSINMKTCQTCQKTKALAEFYKQTTRGAGGVRGTCKLCDNVKKKAYRTANREKLLVDKKADYLANQDRYLANKKEYRQANKGKINALVAARKKVVKQRTPSWLTNFDKLKIKCIYSVAAMLTRENKEPWHVDHIVPLQGKNVSGLHTPSNLRWMRGVDNISKKNRYGVDYA